MYRIHLWGWNFVGKGYPWKPWTLICPPRTMMFPQFTILNCQGIFFYLLITIKLSWFDQSCVRFGYKASCYFFFFLPFQMFGWEYQKFYAFCLAHLFTYQSFPGKLGLAYIASWRNTDLGGMCSPGKFCLFL